MSGIFDRRAKRFISTEQAERAVPSRTVMASRVARDDVNRRKKRIIYKWIKMIFC